MLEFVFWLSFILLAQVYVLYPWTLRFFLLFKKRSKKRTNNGGNEKFISIIISAYDEEAIIEEKIRNTLDLDYPKDKMEILIGDDGSSDVTAEIASLFSEVHLIRKEYNEGKASMLNDLCEIAKGEIFLFSDANTMLEKSALRNLAAEFADEKVGCVCGNLSLKDESGSRLGKTESLYWKGESKLKMLEGKLGAVMGSNGALYAIRSELYSVLPIHKTVMDDFYITAKILMENYSCVYCEKALAFEKTSAAKYGEFKRKVRISRANFNFLSDYLPLLNPLRPIKAYMFLSHKLLRWLSPFLLMAIFLCSILLIPASTFYKIFFTLELVFIAMAFWGLSTYNYFLSMNLALFLGFCKSFFKEKSGAWRREERS
jgi:cellulose synthase/poly-beta-1,6-N-acetylglucosamine synthase-like glycosyltransferase